VNIQEAVEFLLFWVNKKQGFWYSPEECCDIIDRGQISLYSDLQPKYATSQRIKDSLAPFRSLYSFGYSDTLGGVVTIPSNTNYLDLLDLWIQYDISARSIVKQVPVAMINEDVRAIRLDSQIDPVTVSSPIGEMTGKGIIQLYPKVQYTGQVTFLRRPVKPVFAYTTISQRVIVYDAANSVQLEWKESDQNAVLLKALESIGINLSDQEVAQYAEMKTQENYSGINRT